MKHYDIKALFAGTQKNQFKPLEAKKSLLDQQIQITMTQEERDELKERLEQDRKDGLKTSLSAFCRNRSLVFPDLVSWAKSAERGMDFLEDENYNEANLIASFNKSVRFTSRFYGDTTKRDEIKREKEKQKILKERLDKVKTLPPNRKYRFLFRVTLNEANNIRWRAAKCSLSVSDYCRFLIFNYNPFTLYDRHLSVLARKRFYVSVLSVKENGWGNPPLFNECPNCARYKADIEKLRQEIKRLRGSTVHNLKVMDL